MNASVQRSLRLPTLASIRAWRPQLSTEALIVLTSLFFAVAGNGLFWHSAMASHPGSLRYALSLLLLLLGAHGVLLGILVWRWNAKVVTSVLLLVTAFAAHYMSQYHIYLDADMLRNVLATDPKESRELMTVSLVWPVLLLAVLPMALCQNSPLPATAKNRLVRMISASMDSCGRHARMLANVGNRKERWTDAFMQSPPGGSSGPTGGGPSGTGPATAANISTR